MKIPLTQGEFALVDKRDFQKVKKLKWYLIWKGRNHYAVRQSPEGKRIYQHHFIFGKPKKGMVVDHINGNGIDNRRSNLRFCTIGQNVKNQRVIRSWVGIKGVTFCKRTKRFVAQITFNYENYFLGRYKTKEEAAKAYIKAARKFFGKFSPV